MATTEQQIFDRLETSFRIAAECCDTLATSPKVGPTYVKLRKHLGLIEGAARQAAFWRDDSRWLKVGTDAAQVHAKAGNWLRAHVARKNFTALATSMRKLHASTVRLRDQRTGRTGPIMIPMQAAPDRRAVVPGWTPTQGGLLVPA